MCLVFMVAAGLVVWIHVGNDGFQQSLVQRVKNLLRIAVDTQMKEERPQAPASESIDVTDLLSLSIRDLVRNGYKKSIGGGRNTVDCVYTKYHGDNPCRRPHPLRSIPSSVRCWHLSLRTGRRCMAYSCTSTALDSPAYLLLAPRAAPPRMACPPGLACGSGGRGTTSSGAPRLRIVARCGCSFLVWRSLCGTLSID